MPIPIPIDKVITPRYLSVSGLDAAGQPTTFPVTMEVYTGVVGFPGPSGFFGTRTISRDAVRTFLPFQAMKVKAYSQVSFFDVTAMASVATFQGSEDQEVIAGVDR